MTDSTPSVTAFGIGGRFQLEWMAGMDWNWWPESIGMSGRFRSEYAVIKKGEIFINATDCGCGIPFAPPEIFCLTRTYRLLYLNR
jgi:hypothetical protein